MNSQQRKILVVSFIFALFLPIYGLSRSLASGRYGDTRLPEVTVLVLELTLLAGTFFFYKLYGNHPKIKKDIFLALSFFVGTLLVIGLGSAVYTVITYREPTPNKIVENWFPRDGLEIKSMEYLGQRSSYAQDEFGYSYKLILFNKKVDLNSHWPGFMIQIINKSTGQIEDTQNSSIIIDIPPGETKTGVLSFNSAVKLNDLKTYDVKILFDGGSVR